MDSNVEAVAIEQTGRPAFAVGEIRYHGPFAPAAVLALTVGSGLAAFLAIKPTPLWLLALVVILTILGTDGIIRSHPRISSPILSETAPYLFLPTLFTLASGLLLEKSVEGYWALAGAMGVGLLLFLTVVSEYIAIDYGATAYSLARPALSGVAYLTAYLLFTLTYQFDLNLALASLVVGMVSLLAAVEVLHEGEDGGWRILIYGAVVAIALAEVRWTTYFLPLNSRAAGLLLLLTFYLATSLLLHHLRRHFSAVESLEFVIVGLTGLALVLFTNALG